MLGSKLSQSHLNRLLIICVRLQEVLNQFREPLTDVFNFPALDHLHINED
jgi:hypothetical protein